MQERVSKRRPSEARRWALFSPVAFGSGVAAYFGLDVEPDAFWGLVALSFAIAATLAARRMRWTPGIGQGAMIVFAALALLAAGFAAAQLRSWQAAAPVWEGRGAVDIEGRALALEAAADGAPRLLLGDLAIAGARAGETPKRIRISFRQFAKDMDRKALAARLRLILGERVKLRARLFAPPGPAEPGGFDYRRRAWFEGVGALGSAQSWPERRGAAEPRSALDAGSLFVDRLRWRLAERARAALPDGRGEIAAALLVGDRSGLPPEAVEALRASNLAHLLAISGLHMGIVCATIFALVRILCVLPAAPLWRLSPKKLAAIAGLLAGGGYLLLAGASVPTQRAFIMATVVFGAILADRSPVTLRAVALAALIILALRPESLFAPGFQLSFAATTAMVAVFAMMGGALRRRRSLRDTRAQRWSAILLEGAVGVLIASLVAGLATAPFAAFTFNRVAPYGLVANVLAVPLLGLWIMPVGLLALLLAPFGLDAPAFELMGVGVSYVLGVAEMVASWEGASYPIAAGPPLALALLSLGGLFLCLWRRAALRLIGAPLLIGGLVLWTEAPRPDVLIAPGGRLLGVLGADGRSFDRDPTGRYAAEIWIRRDGDLLEAAALRRDLLRDRRGASGWTVSGLRVELSWSRDPDLSRYCAQAGVVIFPRALASSTVADCRVFDRKRLAQSGAVALYSRPAGVQVVTAAEEAGRRFWSDASRRRDLLR